MTALRAGLANAVKFTDRGAVRLACAVEGSRSEPVLHLSISDTGVGIPADKRDMIFECFTRQPTT